MVMFFFLIFGIAWGIVIVIGRDGGGHDEDDQRKCNKCDLVFENKQKTTYKQKKKQIRNQPYIEKLNSIPGKVFNPYLHKYLGRKVKWKNHFQCFELSLFSFYLSYLTSFCINVKCVNRLIVSVLLLVA